MSDENFKSFLRSNINSWWIQWIVIPGIGGMVISLFSCWDCFAQNRIVDYLQDALVSAVLWAVLSNGNGLIIVFLDKRWSWLEHPIKRLIINLLFLLLYSVVASLMVIYAYVKMAYDVDFILVIENQGLFSLLKVPLGITIFISLVMHGRAFLIAWRREVIQVERLKNENLSAKFESLKNQVNPHFLFNSLNALTSLVYSDQTKAVDFIHKLSDVYRYVLDHQYDELVDLETEMELVKSFVFLNKIRFGENLKVDYGNIEELKNGCQVPPLTLQMLVENCLKHNEISKENNLDIAFSIQNERLTIANNINPLSSPKGDSINVGLKNIIARYEFLTKEKVKISNDAGSFSVQVPLLKTSNA